MKDLFGNELPGPGPYKRHVPQQGYAAPPGTGPAGETCRTCRYCRAYRRFTKCGHPIRRGKNTNGTATDILQRTPACSKWEPVGSGNPVTE